MMNINFRWTSRENGPLKFERPTAWNAYHNAANVLRLLRFELKALSCWRTNQ